MLKRISVINAETHNFENYFSRNAGTLRSVGDAQKEPGRESADSQGEDEVERGRSDARNTITHTLAPTAAPRVQVDGPPPRP